MQEIDDSYSLTSFAEPTSLTPDLPYIVAIKEFVTDSIVPLHYADTFELLLCQNLEGNVFIENKHHPFHGHQIFIIPPKIIHSINKKKCEGRMFIFQISLELMSKYIDIKNILTSCNCGITDLMYSKPDYNEISRLMQNLIKEPSDLYERLENILSLFKTLEKTVSNRGKLQLESDDFNQSVLKKLISWTEENFYTKITIEQAARQTGFSKCYFCTFFKARTGITYLSYLNQLRMHHATHLLRKNKSVGDACFECGFDDLSYFIQLFKKINGCTPKEYQMQL